MIRNRGWIINPCDLSEGLIRALGRAGINELGIHPGGGRGAAAKLQAALDARDGAELERLYALADKLGITVEYDEHALSWLLPRDMYGIHPDWFRMDADGTRVNDHNMCASNEEALEYVTRRAFELAERLHEPSHRYSFWIDDVTNARCHCPECSALSAADQALRITNAMAEGFKRYDPLAKTSYLAYHDALAVPACTEPAQGVYLEFAPIERDSQRPMDDPECAENLRLGRAAKELISFFGVKDSRVLEYWVDNSRFSNWTRPPKRMTFRGDIMRRDAEFYLAAGFCDMTSFACFLGPDYIELYGEPPIGEYAGILINAGKTKTDGAGYEAV